MTTIAIDTRTVAAAPTGEPNYLLRRMVALVLFTLAVTVLVLAASAALASVGGTPAAAADDSPAAVPAGERVHVARAGDTLWAIAERYHGDVDLARYVDELIRLNGGTAIQAGAAVLLP